MCFVAFVQSCTQFRGVRERNPAAPEPLVRGPVPGPVYLPSDWDASRRRPRPTSGERPGGHEGTGGQVNLGQIARPFSVQSVSPVECPLEVTTHLQMKESGGTVDKSAVKKDLKE